jgi:hypothetical protein
MDIIVALRKEESELQKKLAAVQTAISALNGGVNGGHKLTAVEVTPKRKQMSATARASISRATKLRWKKFHAEKAKGAQKN